MLSPRRFSHLLIVTCMFLVSPILHAGMKWEIDESRWLSLGAGLRSSFRIIQDDAPDGEHASKRFHLESARLYVNGQILPFLKLEFNTERQEGDQIRVLDAIAKF